MAMKVMRGGSYGYDLRAKGVSLSAESDSPPLLDSDSAEFHHLDFDTDSVGRDKPSYFQDKNPCNHHMFAYSQDKNPCNHHKFAIRALDKFNVAGMNDDDPLDVPKKSYDFVDIVGPISSGYFRERRIFHFNFKAKDKNDASADVETFFSEVTLDKHRSVSVDRVYRLAPTHSLPEKASTSDCLYCLSLNIHHPKFSRFRSGRADHLKSVVSKITYYDNYIKKGKRKQKFSPNFSDPGVHYSGDDGLPPQDFIAKVALRKFHAEHEGTGTNYEFVNVGPCKTVCNKYGIFMHMNFEAKTKDDPQVQTFFAEVVIQMLYFFVSCCKCLGSSASISLKNEIDRCRCFYCRGALIHHPRGPGYLTGRI